MTRNSELIRQWQILRDLDAARQGVTIQSLAAARGVHTRTIRRDLEALQKAGFALYDTKVNGTAMWRLQPHALKGLEHTSWSLTELCAMYFSRSLLEALAGAPFETELARAFAKLEAAMPARMRRYLDRLPRVLQSKSAGRKKADERRLRDVLARAIDACLEQRRADMRYASFSSRQIKNYLVEPQRLSYAQGGIYLTAFVPEYGQIRTFAVERILAFSATGEHFEPRPLPPESFAHSLGVHSGPPGHVVLEFDRRVADYVKEREWHPSQHLTEQPGGSLTLALDVCEDRALRSWILSFGPLVRVVSPNRLAQEIFEEIEEARERYVPKLSFEAPRAPLDERSKLPARARLWRVKS
ncbi:MAG TPA: transcriptional regulator [Vicinamibacterales bacterium]|nr:transcriptional regulator [Vicinamibacterales bacterium]